MSKSLTHPNWLLYGFILVSLVIHVFIFLHIAGIYENSAVSYIELSLQQISKPDVRVIPKPRLREKIPEVMSANPIQVKNIHIPDITPEIVKPDRLNASYEPVSLPKIPDHMAMAGFFVPSLTPSPPEAPIDTHEEQIEFTTAKEYFDMLNLRIHSVKTYPESARSRHLEGRVKLEFVLSKDGTLEKIKIIKSSRHQNLDDAAIEAVKKASPFPRPPPFIFKKTQIPLTLQISILFELA